MADITEKNGETLITKKKSSSGNKKLQKTLTQRNHTINLAFKDYPVQDCQSKINTLHPSQQVS